MDYLKIKQEDIIVLIELLHELRVYNVMTEKQHDKVYNLQIKLQNIWDGQQTSLKESATQPETH